MNRDQFVDIVWWQSRTFPNSTAASKVHHLKEEVAELQIDISNGNRRGARKELADCLILLAGVASALNMTYDDVCLAVTEKMKENKARKWGTPDSNGVVKHVKEESYEPGS